MKDSQKKSRYKPFLIVVAVVGTIACFISWILSLVFYDGIFKPIFWLAALLFCVSAIIGLFSKSE